MEKQIVSIAGASAPSIDKDKINEKLAQVTSVKVTGEEKAVSDMAINAAILLGMDKDSPVFENQAYRVVREVTERISKVPESIPRMLMLQYVYTIIQEYKDTLTRNNKLLINLRKENAEYNALDPAAYSDKLQANLDAVIKLTSGNENVRNQLASFQVLAKELEAGELHKSLNLLNKLNQTNRIRKALISIYQDKKALEWVVKDTFKTADEFKEYLKVNSINEQANLSKDFAKTIRTEIGTLVYVTTQFLEDSINNEEATADDKEALDRMKKLIDSISELDLSSNLKEAVEIIGEFKKEYKRFNSKVIEIPEGIKTTVGSIITIYNLVIKFMGEATDESMAELQKLIDASVEDNKDKVNISWRIADIVAIKVFDLNTDEKLEDLPVARTLLLASLFHLLDIVGGTATLSLIHKFRV